MLQSPNLRRSVNAYSVCTSLVLSETIKKDSDLGDTFVTECDQVVLTICADSTADLVGIGIHKSLIR
ncbi:hypothetical protein GGD56_007144, partial [Rhizobium mongolense]|nr:hypothetical protein [Rhizobium mongolense]